MQFPSARTFGGPSAALSIPRRLWPVLLALAGSTAATAGGALAAASPSLAMVGAAGVVGMATLAFASSALALLGVLTIRSLTDSFATVPIVAGLNAGAVVGLVLIASAGALVVARIVEKGSRIQALPMTIILSFGVVYWFGIGLLHYGADPSLIRELVRMLSILAVALIAANSDRSVTASRLGMIIVVAAMIPAVLVVWEAISHWPEMVGGGLRPRGTMSHPNAAAILFGIAGPMAVWKATYDSSGRRYFVAAAIFVVAVLFTRSLGGLAQTTVAMLALGALQTGRPIYRVGVVLAVVGVLVVFVADPLGISRVDELESAPLSIDQVSNDGNSFGWRLVNWARFIDEWKKAKLLGHGLGTTDEIIAPLGHLPHSDPIRFLVETGVVGVVLIGIGYLLVVNRLVLLSRIGPHRTMATTTLAIVAGVSTHALVTHVSFNTAPVYVLAALLGWVLTDHPEAPPKPVAPEEPRAAQALLAATRRAPQPPPSVNR
ncbi:MAG: O-antigen ligase family protein [Dehalococcoidia bacterium]|nr:O-antigen ligase family protein [Dehalococcoidia bacterium]